MLDIFLQITIDVFTPEELYFPGDNITDERKSDFAIMLLNILSRIRSWKGTYNRVKSMAQYQNFLIFFPNIEARLEDQYKVYMDTFGWRTPDISQKEIFRNLAVANLFCGFCGAVQDAEKILKCSRCRSVYYCNRKCQKKHWKKEHKDKCMAERKLN